MTGQHHFELLDLREIPDDILEEIFDKFNNVILDYYYSPEPKLQEYQLNKLKTYNLSSRKMESNIRRVLLCKDQNQMYRIKADAETTYSVRVIQRETDTILFSTFKIFKLVNIHNKEKL